MSVLTGNYIKLGCRIGRAYSINTLGSILGAFMRSFILIRYVGISSSLKISILVSVAAGLDEVPVDPFFLRTLLRG